MPYAYCQSRVIVFIFFLLNRSSIYLSGLTLYSASCCRFCSFFVISSQKVFVYEWLWATQPIKASRILVVSCAFWQMNHIVSYHISIEMPSNNTDRPTSSTFYSRWDSKIIIHLKYNSFLFFFLLLLLLGWRIWTAYNITSPILNVNTCTVNNTPAYRA